MTSPSPFADAVSPRGQWLMSIAFWLALGVAAVSFAVLTLAPRCLESERLRLRYRQNAVEVQQLRAESVHLQRVANALRNEPDFVSRVASAELNAQPSGQIRIPVREELGFDARIPVAPLSEESLSAPAYLPVLQRIAESKEIRTRCWWATAGLLLFAFTCLNDGFLSGGTGRMLQTPCRWIARRYSTR